MDTLLTAATFGTFLDNLKEGVIILATDGAVLYANQTAEQLFALHQPISHWQALFQHTESTDAWSHWKQLLSPPHETSLQTATRTLDVQALPLVWQGQPLIQLILTPAQAPSEAELSAASSAELLQHLHALRRENSQLKQRTAQIQRLEIITEASSAIASSLEVESVLTALGDHMIEAVNGVGYTIYRWGNNRTEIEIFSEYTRIPEKQTVYSAGTFPLANYTLFDQLLENNAWLVSQVSLDDHAYLPDTPSWLLPGITYNISLMPILSGSEPFGAIVLANNSQHGDFNENELQVLGALVNQTSVALEKVQLFEDIFERESFMAALGRVSLAINATLDLPTVLSLICQESLSIFGVDGVYIWQLNEQNELVALAAEGYGKEAFANIRTSANDPHRFASTILASGESQYINQFAQHAEISVQLPHPESIAAVMGIPLVREGSIIGVLVLVDRHNPDRFTIRDLDKANAFAVQVAIAIHNAQLVTRLRELNDELDQRVAQRTLALGEERDRFLMLLRITTELSASLDEDRVLVRALELINGVIQASEGLILLIDESSREFVIRAAFGMEGNIPPRGRPSGMMRDEGLAGWVVQNREAVILRNAPDDPRWTDRPNARHYRSVLAVPLIFSGEVVGVLMLFHTEASAFTEQQLRLVEGAGAQVSNAIYNAHLYLLIRNQAERVGGMLREEQVNTAKMQAILESIADGVLVANEQGQAILVNVACSEILGIGRDQLVGQNLLRLSGLYGSAGDLWLETIQDWASKSDQIEGQTYLADELFIPDENKVVSVHVAPVFAGGQFFGTVSIFRDRTKEVEVDRVKTEFVSTVSHELRTPLTSIKGYTDLMLMGATGAIGDAQMRYLKVIKNNADRLQELVNDLLDISRLETGKTRLDLRPIDVNLVINQVVDHLKGRIKHEEKEIEAQVIVPSKLPLAHADYTRVTQILTNLVDNAFNYTPIHGRVIIQAAVKEDQILVGVQDTGIGIAPENLEKIFDRFFRADDARVQKVSGTGLGLAIVRSLVEMHGGELLVESNLGEGSTFTFNLPVVRQEGRAMKEESEK